MNGIENWMAADLVEHLNTLGEQERIEAKLATKISHSVMETVCAYANEPNLGGGWLLLGVKEERETLFPVYEVEGIGDADKIGNDLLSQCRTVFNAAVSPRIHTETVKGRVVLRVWVPESPPSAKPVYFLKEGLPAGAFRRIGAADVRCDEDDLVVLYHGLFGVKSLK